ncbi:DNA-binding transcriptional activator FeaR [Vibrio aerogenes CECT 7868]|uniref:DNA-binding transcriptional activator FeaR n=1 Tax=Vibrio aerogenes CECT 7868 TaxID=1216006 RepID=A0A1M5XAR5_9VIBR|nr:helix-turn-helix domain-containing protein [Vibrio aerogenes]SHH96819.1 DNA-binding transcriptional activator FeaR [Vibrio aerogenes CECT 7868]
MTSLQFEIHFPQGRLSPWVQAIWSARTDETQPGLSRRLFADAGSGLMINSGPEIRVDNQILHDRIWFQPTQKKAHMVHLPPGTNLSGIRFHPGMGACFLSQFVSHPEPGAAALSGHFEPLIQQLRDDTHPLSRIEKMTRTLIHHLHDEMHHPVIFRQAVQMLEHAPDVRQVSQLPLSQRQIERLFQRRIGMTPKYYQRLRRIRTVLNDLKENPHQDLARVAVEFGFSDQAHFIRECRTFTGITPKQYVKSRQDRYTHI